MQRNIIVFGLLLFVLGSLTHISFCAEEGAFSQSEEESLNRILYDARPNCLHKLKHFGAVSSSRFNKCGNKILVAGLDSVSVWDTCEGSRLLLLDHNQTDIAEAWFSSNGNHIITKPVEREGALWQWSAISGIFEGKMTHVLDSDLYLGPPRGEHGHTLAIDHLAVLIVDAITSRVSCSLGHKKRVASAAFNHDKTKVVSGAIDGTVCIWKVGKTVQQAVNQKINKKILERIKSRRARKALEQFGF